MDRARASPVAPKAARVGGLFYKAPPASAFTTLKAPPRASQQDEQDVAVGTESARWGTKPACSIMRQSSLASAPPVVR
jgi:hypothetical protein